MSKVTRTRMTRGIQLMAPQHVQVLEDIGAELENTNITHDQLETPWAPWTAGWNIPWIDSRFIQGTGARMFGTDVGDVLYTIPFIPFLPQELYDVDTLGMPIIILDEVHFGHDQRGEPYALGDHHAGVADPLLNPNAVASEGMFYENEVNRLNVSIIIYEKEPAAFADNVVVAKVDPANTAENDAWVPRREVFSMEIEADAYSGADFRFNPLPRTDVGVQLDPMKTYLLAIKAPELTPVGGNLLRLALVNCELVLKGRCRLMLRDVNTGNPLVDPDIQNIPTAHQGAPTSPTIGIDLPEAGDAITATAGAEGFDIEFAKIDDHFDAGLTGGYSKWSHNQGDRQSILDDAAWFMLPIPMWQNQRNGEVNRISIDFVSNNGGTPWADPIICRQRIKIRAPMVIHHVVAALNWQTSQSLASYNAGLYDGTHLRHTVNVGIGTGIRGDLTRKQDVAYLQWELDDNGSTGTGTAHMDHLIDRVGWPNPTGIANGAVLAPHDAFAWEVMSIPLVRTATLGTGHPPVQGVPFFVGKARTSTQDRTEVGTQIDIGAASRAANTAGLEQWIEVLWEVAPGDGVGPGFVLGDFDNIWGFGPGLPNDVPYVGFQGYWVYLLGKKHLTVR